MKKRVLKSKFDWKKYLVDCMQSTEYFCLATVDKDGVWSSPVYFAWDENFNLYFLSQPHSRHMRNLEKDRRVAISIYSTAQSAFGDVAGIQLDGKAYILTDKREAEKAYNTYYGRMSPDTSKNPKKDEDSYIIEINVSNATGNYHEKPINTGWNHGVPLHNFGGPL